MVFLEKGKEIGVRSSQQISELPHCQRSERTQGEKKKNKHQLLGGKQALLTQSREGDLPGHRGENKLTSKKSLSPPSLLPKTPLEVLRHQEFVFQHSVIETPGHPGQKGKAGTGKLK